MEKVALVTGASRGIGAATALLLGKHGYKVIVNYQHNATEANTIVDKIVKNGSDACAIQADISQENEVINLFQQTMEYFGPVSALVNNAGINGGNSLVKDISKGKLDIVFGTNVYGTFFCCREAIHQMKQHGGGSIVNVSSEAAKFGGTQLAHYAAAKAAVNTYTIACAREVADFGIRVNAVSPGIINTSMHIDTEQQEKLLSSLPMRRMGKPEEVAESILWLLSDAAAYISGAIIPITGAR